jgi:hypothetical protein
MSNAAFSELNYVIKHHAMNAYEEWRYSFTILDFYTIDVNCQHHAPASLPVRIPLTVLNG